MFGTPLKAPGLQAHPEVSIRFPPRRRKRAREAAIARGGVLGYVLGLGQVCQGYRDVQLVLSNWVITPI